MPPSQRRSKTGCRTCKARSKKCDEEWDEAGHCKRCKAGGFECIPCNSTIPYIRQPRKTVAACAREQTAAPSTPAPSSSASRSPTPPPAAIERASSRPVASTSAHTLDHHHHAYPAPARLAGLPYESSAPLPQHEQLALSPNTLLNSLTAAAAFPTPDPFTDLFSIGGMDIDLSQILPRTSGAGGADFFPPSFLPSSSAGLWAGTGEAQQGGSAAAPAHGQGPATKQAQTADERKKAADSARLGQIYIKIVQSWMVALPQEARKAVRLTLEAFNKQSTAARAARNAVAAAYMAALADRPRPSRRGRRGLAEILTGGSHPREDGEDDDAASRDGDDEDRLEEEEDGGEGGTRREGSAGKRKQRGDAPFKDVESEKESARWMSEALAHLTSPHPHPVHALSDNLWGVLDLQLYEFVKGGAGPSYRMLSIGDKIVRDAFGPEPVLDLTSLRGEETFSLRMFAMADVSRCIVLRGRKTLFRLVSGNSVASSPAASTPESTSSISTFTEEDVYAAYLGLPESLAVILAEIVNLCAALSTTDAAAVFVHANALEHSIRSWQPAQFKPCALTDSTSLVARTAVGEMWRCCSLIVLYQSIHRVGALHPVLRTALSQLLSLLEATTHLSGELAGFLGCPAFLAGSIAVYSEDREAALRHLQGCGPERVWEDNLKVIRRVWAETDRTGVPADWHELMQREELAVAFF